MCISGRTREWARAKPSIFNYLGRNFMPYTFLGTGLMFMGAAPHLALDDAPLAIDLVSLPMFLLGAPIVLISMIHWPLFLSPPWYRRWYARGGRMANNAPLWDPPDARNQPYRG